MTDAEFIRHCANKDTLTQEDRKKLEEIARRVDNEIW